jgi:hypothetical protein
MGLKRTTILAIAMLAVGASAVQAQIRITEVAPWSSGNSPLGVDWFELTNVGGAAVDVTGWRVDDGSAAFGSSLALNGITSIAAGESVIFLESASSLASEFKTLWFGGLAPTGLQIGNYTGSGIGLSTGGDAVNIYTGGGALQANVSFGVTGAGPSFPTLDNTVGATGSISTFSAVGVNGAFAAFSDSLEIGSPGLAVPEPTTALLVLGAVGCAGLARYRRD